MTEDFNECKINWRIFNFFYFTFACAALSSQMICTEGDAESTALTLIECKWKKHHGFWGVASHFNSIKCWCFWFAFQNVESEHQSEPAAIDSFLPEHWSSFYLNVLQSHTFYVHKKTPSYDTSNWYYQSNVNKDFDNEMKHNVPIKWMKICTF